MEPNLTLRYPSVPLTLLILPCGVPAPSATLSVLSPSQLRTIEPANEGGTARKRCHRDIIERSTISRFELDKSSLYMMISPMSPWKFPRSEALNPLLREPSTIGIDGVTTLSREKYGDSNADPLLMSKPFSMSPSTYSLYTESDTCSVTTLHPSSGSCCWDTALVSMPATGRTRKSLSRYMPMPVRVPRMSLSLSTHPGAHLASRPSGTARYICPIPSRYRRDGGAVNK
mmetsp:Transcript_37272/g.87715  ORF Transcript_37272/g.87715 Transcript_37272/m.87715 type:complete len:229 (-) Transcript_37272:1242-1928(-)